MRAPAEPPRPPLLPPSPALTRPPLPAVRSCGGIVLTMWYYPEPLMPTGYLMNALVEMPQEKINAGHTKKKVDGHATCESVGTIMTAKDCKEHAKASDEAFFELQDTSDRNPSGCFWAMTNQFVYNPAGSPRKCDEGNSAYCVCKEEWGKEQSIIPGVDGPLNDVMSGICRSREGEDAEAPECLDDDLGAIWSTGDAANWLETLNGFLPKTPAGAGQQQGGGGGGSVCTYTESGAISINDLLMMNDPPSPDVEKGDTMTDSICDRLAENMKGYAGLTCDEIKEKLEKELEYLTCTLPAPTATGAGATVTTEPCAEFATMEDVGTQYCKKYDSSAGGTPEKCKNAYFKAAEDGFLYPCEVVGSPDNFECNKAGNDKACNPKAPPPTTTMAPTTTMMPGTGIWTAPGCEAGFTCDGGKCVPGEKPPKPPVKCTPECKDQPGHEWDTCVEGKCVACYDAEAGKISTLDDREAWGWGDPHMVTFEGNTYDYMGRGIHEYCKWNIHNMSHKIQFFGCGTICKDVEPLEDGTWGCGESSSVAWGGEIFKTRVAVAGAHVWVEEESGNNYDFTLPNAGDSKNFSCPACPNNQQLKVTHMEAKDDDYRAPGASLKFEFGTGSATCGDNVTLSTWVFDFRRGKSRMPTGFVSNMRVRMSELHSRGAYGICKDETVWNMEGGDKCNANEGHGRCRIEPQHNGLDMTDMENNVWPATMMPTLGQFDGMCEVNKTLQTPYLPTGAATCSRYNQSYESAKGACKRFEALGATMLDMCVEDACALGHEVAEQEGIEATIENNVAEHPLFTCTPNPSNVCNGADPDGPMKGVKCYYDLKCGCRDRDEHQWYGQVLPPIEEEEDDEVVLAEEGTVVCADEEACKAEAKLQGLTLGDGKLKFSAGSYTTKGCYYEGDAAFFGLGGNPGDEETEETTKKSQIRLLCQAPLKTQATESAASLLQVAPQDAVVGGEAWPYPSRKDADKCNEGCAAVWDECEASVSKYKAEFNSKWTAAHPEAKSDPLAFEKACDYVGYFAALLLDDAKLAKKCNVCKLSTNHCESLHSKGKKSCAKYMGTKGGTKKPIFEGSDETCLTSLRKYTLGDGYPVTAGKVLTSCEIIGGRIDHKNCEMCRPPMCTRPFDCGMHDHGLHMCRPCFDYAGNPDLKPPMKGMPDCANINSEKQALSGGSGISGTGPQHSLLQAFAKRAAKK